jgi:hypothetical protein
VKQSHRHAMKRLAPATALIVATGLSAAGLASSSVAADASAPALKLVSSTKQQLVKRTKGEPVYLYDLGIHAVAEKASFEIRTQRGAGYRDPIKATLTLDSGTEKKTTTLPPALFKDVQGLNKFFGYSVTNKAGKVVKRGELGFCPNSWAATRAVIDGATFTRSARATSSAFSEAGPSRRSATGRTPRRSRARTATTRCAF